MASGDVKFHFREIQYGGGRQFENSLHLNGHNSVAVAHIRTKFGSVTTTDVPETEYLQILLPQKSNMAADRHFENT